MEWLKNMMHHDSIETHTSHSGARSINTLQLSAEHMGAFIDRCGYR
jgi:hypothetical protein